MTNQTNPCGQDGPCLGCEFQYKCFFGHFAIMTKILTDDMTEKGLLVSAGKPHSPECGCQTCRDLNEDIQKGLDEVKKSWEAWLSKVERKETDE